MLLCYEVWPYQARQHWSGFFFFLIGSFHFMADTSQYYDVIQNVNKNGINLAAYTFFVLAIILTLFVVIYCRILHFRIMKKRHRFLFFKWGFWLLEILYFPLLTNIVEYSSC